MRSTISAIASGGGMLLLALVCTTASATAQMAAPLPPVTHLVSLAPGSIQGIVHDEHGFPVPGAVVSALGATTAVAVTDRGGRFELRTLSPGPYLLRAHLAGYVAPRAQVVEVHSS